MNTLNQAPGTVESREALADKAMQHLVEAFEQGMNDLTDLQNKVCEAVAMFSPKADAVGYCSLGAKIFWSPTNVSIPGNEDMILVQNAGPLIIEGFSAEAFKQALLDDPDLA